MTHFLWCPALLWDKPKPCTCEPEKKGERHNETTDSVGRREGDGGE